MKITYNSPSFRRTEKACSCMWLILFRCKTLVKNTQKQSFYRFLIFLIPFNCGAMLAAVIQILRDCAALQVSYRNPNKSQTNQSKHFAFAIVWIMQMYTYRTVSILQECNETFPMLSMRFPSKSLKECIMKSTHTHNRNTQSNSLKDTLLLKTDKTAIDFLTSNLQPVQSRHFQTDIIQLCHRVVQQNPVNQ